MGALIAMKHPNTLCFPEPTRANFVSALVNIKTAKTKEQNACLWVRGSPEQQITNLCSAPAGKRANQLLTLNVRRPLPVYVTLMAPAEGKKMK